MTAKKLFLKLVKMIPPVVPKQTTAQKLVNIFSIFDQLLFNQSHP
jgi:hypothetical protein